jgi:FtsP/CotA-like multicopper oxidase with cupredoxin domain
MAMKYLISLGMVSMLVGVGSAQAGQCPISNVIEDPPEFAWTDSGSYWSGTLEIGEATLTVGTDTLTTRAYRQAGGSFSIPGPTMRMTPGADYVLTFKNTLEYDTPSPRHNVSKIPTSPTFIPTGSTFPARRRPMT